jgi:hypothetical protein
LLVGFVGQRGREDSGVGIAGKGMTSALALAIYGQRGDGFVECENLKIQIANLLEGLFVAFFLFFS